MPHTSFELSSLLPRQTEGSQPTTHKVKSITMVSSGFFSAFVPASATHRPCSFLKCTWPGTHYRKDCPTSFFCDFHAAVHMERVAHFCTVEKCVNQAIYCLAKPQANNEQKADTPTNTDLSPLEQHRTKLDSLLQEASNFQNIDNNFGDQPEFSTRAHCLKMIRTGIFYLSTFEQWQYWIQGCQKLQHEKYMSLGLSMPTHCKEHYSTGMINSQDPMCVYEGCTQPAAHNFPKMKQKVLCKDHAHPHYMLKTYSPCIHSYCLLPACSSLVGLCVEHINN